MRNSRRAGEVKLTQVFTILIVEDDGIIARDIQYTLEQLGYKVPVVASSGRAAIQKAEEIRPDLVLMDIVLRGEMDGIEAAEIIRSRYDIPVIFLSAHADENTLQRAKIQGPFGYILKPFQERDLTISVEMALNRHQMERKLRESEKRYRTIVEDMPALVCRYLADGVLTFVNEHYCRYFNQTREKLVGQDFFRFIPETERKQVRQHFASLTPERPVVTYEHQALAPDGTLRWQRWTDRALFDEQGNPVEYQSVGVDITERVRVEEALQQYNRNLALLNRVSQTLIATLDLPHILERLLRAAVAVADAEDSSVWLWDEDQPGELVCRAILHQGEFSLPSDLRLGPGQGVAGWVAQKGQSAVVSAARDDPRFFPGVDQQIDFHTTSLLAVPLTMRDHTHGVLEVVNKKGAQPEGLAQDFTADDRVLVEMLAASAAIAIDNARLIEALRRYGMELETRNQDLDSFAHTVAHDLKNPLAFMVGYAEVLEEDASSMPAEAVRRYLRTIAQNGRKMTNIIDELLLLAGVRKIKQVELVPLDMLAVVIDARDRLADLIEAHQAEIILPDTWPTAMGHGPWVEEVWVNYISNAIKDGGRPPRVALGASLQADGAVRFWVRDNGPGLKPEEQARLFRSFERLDRVRAKGHGLGLSIALRIVEKLGGQVGVESQVGQWSVFSFTLPSAES